MPCILRGEMVKLFKLFELANGRVKAMHIRFTHLYLAMISL